MSLTTEILEGNLRKLTATFRTPGVDADLDDVTTWDLTDPTTATFTRKRRRASSSTLETWVYATDMEVTRDSVGVYSIVLAFADPGSWVVGAEGTGTCTAYEETGVDVTEAEARA